MAKSKPDPLHKVPGFAPEHGGAFHDEAERQEWYAKMEQADKQVTRKVVKARQRAHQE